MTRMLFALAATLLVGCSGMSGTDSTDNGGDPIDDPVRYAADTMAVRAILDSNGLFSRGVESVTGVGGGRITALWLPDEGITVLPPAIGLLESLTVLDLRNNLLSELPAEIGSLHRLDRLWVSNNVVSIVPTQIGNLTALTALYLPDNCLEALPAEIGRLSSIQRIELGNNALSSLPDSIMLLEGIRVSVMNNRLCNVSAQLEQWLDRNAEELSGWSSSQDCSGNPSLPPACG